MKELERRRLNILRLVRRHKEYLVRLELVSRTPEEVFLWLIAHSVTLQKGNSEILGLWYGFGSLYQTATKESPGEALRGHQICKLLEGAFTWSKFAKIRDRLLLNFIIQLRKQTPTQEVDGVYYYNISSRVVQKVENQGIVKSGFKKSGSHQNGYRTVIPSTYFTWPTRSRS